jgi:sugar lactone lactonase YvrE
VASATYTITPKALPPVFSPVSGTFAGPTQVTITSVDGYPIHVTTDGSTPTAASPLYGATFTVGVSQTVKAIVIGPDASQNSDVASQTYTITTPFAVASTITTIAGNGTTGYVDGVTATSGSFNPLANPVYANRSLGSAVANSYTTIGMAVDGSGNVFFADFNNNAVRRVGTDGKITTVAGTGVAGALGINGPGTAAQLNQPTGLAFDGSGNLYISDTGNNRIVELTTGGTLTLIKQGNGNYNGGYNMGFAPGTLRFDSTGTLNYMDTNYDLMSTLAGPRYTVTCNIAGSTFIGCLYFPIDFVLGASSSYVLQPQISGNLCLLHNYVAYMSCTYIAGSGYSGGVGAGQTFAGDGGPSTSATLYDPRALALDPSGNLYIADHANARVRRIAPDGTVTTVAGNGLYGSSGDGGDSRKASLAGPIALTTDSHGNLYIMDGYTIRKVTFQ